jgi:hypothetical protein
MSCLKKILVTVLSVLCIAGSALWIHYWQFKKPKHNVPLHTRVGEVMAEETVRVLGGKGKIVIVGLDKSHEPEMKTQISAFKTALNKLGKIDVRNYELDAKEQKKYGVGTGLSGRRFARIVQKNQNADAIVSFVGAPHLKDEDLGQWTNKVPKLIAEARSPDNLPKLFEEKMIEVAVVSRFQFPSPVQGNPRTPQEWFDKRYQVVTATNAAVLPKPE